MKKLLVITLAVALIGELSVGPYAYRGGNMSGQRGGMMGGPRGDMSGCGGMYDRGPGGNRGNGPEGCPRFNAGNQNMTCPRLNAQGQPGTAPQVITEDKAKEAVQTFVAKYLPGYTVEKVEKDNRRPMYSAILKGPEGAEMQLFVRGFDGQIMHLFPKVVEVPAENAPAENK